MATRNCKLLTFVTMVKQCLQSKFDICSAESDILSLKPSGAKVVAETAKCDDVTLQPSETILESKRVENDQILKPLQNTAHTKFQNLSYQNDILNGRLQSCKIGNFAKFHEIPTGSSRFRSLARHLRHQSNPVDSKSTKGHHLFVVGHDNPHPALEEKINKNQEFEHHNSFLKHHKNNLFESSLQNGVDPVQGISQICKVSEIQKLPFNNYSHESKTCSMNYPIGNNEHLRINNGPILSECQVKCVATNHAVTVPEVNHRNINYPHRTYPLQPFQSLLPQKFIENDVPKIPVVQQIGQKRRDKTTTETTLKPVEFPSYEDDVLAADFLELYNAIQYIEEKREFKQMKITSKLSADPDHLLESDLEEMDDLLEKMYERRDSKLSSFSWNLPFLLHFFGKNGEGSLAEDIISVARDEQSLDEALAKIKNLRFSKLSNYHSPLEKKRKRQNTLVQGGEPPDCSYGHSNNATVSFERQSHQIFSGEHVTLQRDCGINKLSLTKEFLNLWKKPVELHATKNGLKSIPHEITLKEAFHNIDSSCTNSIKQSHSTSSSSASFSSSISDFYPQSSEMRHDKPAEISEWEILYCAPKDTFL